ncbi:cytokinesis protein sepA-like [Amphibalanus amphitrite]|uniref:cytokinesis protein sepA-like n=1 Tax=Amphibalanus amphitrite TaxID=1232801 RepID=UPI001C915E78|nr:cytokinesis protein sepA-like [Amphibalanus amphitrite]
MAGETQPRKRKIREKGKDVGSDHSGDEELEDSPAGGGTCASAVVVLLLVAGVGVLGTLVYIQSGAVSYGGPPAPQPPPARPAEVVVDRSEPLDSSQPPQPHGGEGGEDTVLAATTESVTADDPAQVAPPGDEKGSPPSGEHTAGPGGAPPPPPPPGQESGEVRLEGSEEVPLDAQLEQPVRKEVRVRQMLRIHTHADGSITEEVVSEELLQPGDEGYDDLGKEPVTVAVHSGPAEPAPTAVRPTIAITADESD